MNNPKVTVALSVYNVADYVRAALDSILAQSFKDFELLCIDDASTDGTWEILQEYASRDGRLRLLRQETNQGLSVSRNRAIEEARGEYLLMLDGDDLFAPEMLDEAYKKAGETDADMVMWDYAIFHRESELDTASKEPSGLAAVLPSDKISLLKRPAFTPVRLLKMEAVRRLQIHFAPGLTKQDIPVHWKLMTTLDKISIIPKRLLYYRQSPTNTTSRKERSVFSLAYVMDITKRQLVDEGLYQTYKDEFLRSRLSLLQGMYDHVKPDLKVEAVRLVKERLGDDEKEYIKNPKNELTRRTRDFYGMLQGNLMPTIRYKGFNAIRWIYRKMK